MNRLLAILTACAALATGCAAQTQSADEAALLALDQAYTTEWKAGDADGVLALFTDDAVVIPHHGDAPVVGAAALRDFWFPAGGSPTMVPEFNHHPDAVYVDGDLGYVHGRFELTWIYEGERTTIPEGNYLTVATRTKAGWRIKTMSWNDDPRKWIVKPAVD